MVDRFYSKENIDRLAEAMTVKGLTEAAGLLQEQETRAQLANILRLGATPNYIDYSQKQNLKLSFERTWAENIEKLEQLTAEFLTLDAEGFSKEEIPDVLSILRTNFESQLPLYRILDDWFSQKTAIQKRLSERDALRQSLILELQLLENTLASLLALPSSGIPNNYQIQLQLVPNDTTEPFLPLPLAIHKYQTQIAEKKELMQHRERRFTLDTLYDYLLSQMIQAAREQIDGQGSLDSLSLYLETFIEAQEHTEAREYLSSHLRHIQSVGLQDHALTRHASTFPVAKGTIQKTVFLFCLLFIAGIFILSIKDFINPPSSSSH